MNPKRWSLRKRIGKNRREKLFKNQNYIKLLKLAKSKTRGARKKGSSVNASQQAAPEAAVPTIVVDATWDIEAYRNPHDTHSVWNLKKWFMELHKETIAESELVPLAQTFACIQAYGCLYSPELMERLKDLGEPIARVYHSLKHSKCTQTLVSSKEAVRMWQRGISYTKHLAEERQRQMAPIRPIFPAHSLKDVFQNIVVVNNSLKETTEWFERVGGGTISIAVCPIEYGVYEVKAYVSNFFITKAAGPYEKAYTQCVLNLMEILKNYCYRVNYKKQHPDLYYNVERLLKPEQSEHEYCLQDTNIGYRMLQKLGWDGGPLGSAKTGIVHPIQISAKLDRRGLGCTSTTVQRSAKRPKKQCEIDVHFYNELMDMVLKRKPYYDLIFSPEFTNDERIVLNRMAIQRRIRCEIRQSNFSDLQFVVKRYPLPPHEVLAQALVDKHPIVLQHYEALPPKLGSMPI